MKTDKIIKRILVFIGLKIAEIIGICLGIVAIIFSIAFLARFLHSHPITTNILGIISITIFGGLMIWGYIIPWCKHNWEWAGNIVERFKK